jgi:photosystem II stability/assembly factor-like uncharacterized protein
VTIHGSTTDSRGVSSSAAVATFNIGWNGRFYAEAGSLWLKLSTDSGATWYESRLLRNGPEPGRLAISPSDPDILYVFGSHSLLSGGRGEAGEAWRTTDGGQNWELRARKAPRGSPAVDGADPSIVYLNADGVALRSTDGATSFEQIGIYDSDVLPESRTNRRNAFGYTVMSPDGSRMWFVGSTGGVYRSLDRGFSWQRLPDVPFSNGVISVSGSPHYPQVLFAVTLEDELWAYREPDTAP